MELVLRNRSACNEQLAMRDRRDRASAARDACAEPDRGDASSARAVSRGADRGRGGVDLQLVLAARRPGRVGLPDALGQSVGHEAVRGSEIHRRSSRCALDRRDAAAGHLANRLHLPSRDPLGARSAPSPNTFCATGQRACSHCRTCWHARPAAGWSAPSSSARPWKISRGSASAARRTSPCRARSRSSSCSGWKGATRISGSTARAAASAETGQPFRKCHRDNNLLIGWHLFGPRVASSDTSPPRPTPVFICSRIQE